MVEGKLEEAAIAWSDSEYENGESEYWLMDEINACRRKRT